jgi:rhamnulokinase
MTATALAVDLGSSSGRIIAGTLRDGRVEQVEVHRFAHAAALRDGKLTWDVDNIWTEVRRGLHRALEAFPDAATVSVDTWGVDYVPLDDDGRPVDVPRAYRDERTVRTLDAFRARLPDAAVWEATGIAPATINTANQLFATLQEEPDVAVRTSQILFLPDYFTFMLSGVRGWSRSIASTGALCRPGATQWAPEVFDALGIPRSWVGELTVEHSVAGPCTVPGLEQLTVVRAGAHDSACAVQALQRDGDTDGYFLSSGSWSVLGVTRDRPLLSADARALGITNEARAEAGVRPLFNITGLWILQECQRQWAAAGVDADTVALIGAAEAAGHQGMVIDVDAPGFSQPGGMVQRVEAALGVEGLDPGRIVRCVFESLAQRYARGIDDLVRLTGTPATKLNVMGGGSRNALLCRLTAEATGVPVVAGPAEASVLGSLLAQFTTVGALADGDRNDVVVRSADTRTYEVGGGH